MDRINRNEWTESTGTGGQGSPEYADITKAIELKPYESRLYAVRSTLWLANEKDTEKVMADAKKALELDPYNAQLCVSLASEYNLKGDKVIGMDYLYKAGNIYAKLNQRDDLIQVIQRMTKINPKSPLVQKLYELAYPEVVDTGDSTPEKDKAKNEATN